MSSAPEPEAALAEVLTALRESIGAVDSSLDGNPQSQESDTGDMTTACALCRLADRSAERSLRAFFSEFVNDPAVRVRFRKSRGFCREHVPLLARCGDALGVAILYADLADEVRIRWRTNVSGPKRSLFSRLLPSNDAAECPSCAAESEAEARYAGALAAGLARDPNIWQTVHASRGLCRRHVECIAAAAPPSDAAKLLAMESAKIDDLFAELEEFVRKNDYRFRGEPWGSERDAWRRALLRLRK